MQESWPVQKKDKTIARNPVKETTKAGAPFIKSLCQIIHAMVERPYSGVQALFHPAFQGFPNMWGHFSFPLR